MSPFLTPSLLLVIALGLAGCGGSDTAPQQVSRADLAAVWQSAPPPAATPAVQPMAVKEGVPPLAYWVEAGAVVRVTDVNQQLDVARGFVPGRSVVRVDANKGVLFGGETIYPGPLPEGSRYVISLEPDERNTMRHETVQVRPRRQREAGERRD